MTDEWKSEGSRQDAGPKIAIIGTEGSGKTVLITTLAHRFSQRSSAGVFLNPLDNETIRYVERNWRALCSEEWPAGTPLGQLFELQWCLECGGDSPIQCDLRIVDAAGQDLRRLFSDDEPTNERSYPSQLQKLAAYCNSADVVICLVNLKDFLGEGDPERRLDNQIVITSALRRLAADPARRLCLLFTQIDLYQEVLKRHGDWAGVTKHVLPYVHSAHLTNGQAKIRAVAAVGQSVVSVGADGIPRRVPAPGFEPIGFDGLMGWLVKEIGAVTAVREAARTRWMEAEQARGDIEVSKRLNIVEGRWKNLIRILLLIAIVICKYWIGILLLIATVIWWWTAPPAPRPFIVKIQPFWKAKIDAQMEYGRIYDDVTIRNKSGKMLKNLTLNLEVQRSGIPIKSVPLPPADVPDAATHRWRIPAWVSRNDGLKLRVVDYGWGER